MPVRLQCLLPGFLKSSHCWPVFTAPSISPSAHRGSFRLPSSANPCLRIWWNLHLHIELETDLLTIAEAVVKKSYFSEHTVLVNNETAGSWFPGAPFFYSVSRLESVSTWLVDLQEWVINVCLCLWSCPHVYVYFDFLDMFSVWQKHLLYLHLFLNRIPAVKKI